MGRLGGRARALLLALIVVAVLGSVPSSAQAQEDGGGPTTTLVPAGEPTLRTERGVYDRGQTIEVRGRNWPVRSVVTIELCGNDARAGTVDCDTRNAQTSAIGRDGELRGSVLAASPPSPCPCVVRVYVPGGQVDLAIRVEVTGVPFEELEEEVGPRRQLEVTRANLSGGGGLGSWFGFAPTRTLELRIENTGEVAVPRSSIRAAWGRSSDASRPIDLEDLERLEPGDAVVVRQDVTFAPLAIGEYVVAGQIAGFEDSRFRTTMSTYPYGLVLLGFLAIFGAGASLYGRRTRTDGADDQPTASGDPAAATDS